MTTQTQSRFARNCHGRLRFSAQRGAHQISIRRRVRLVTGNASDSCRAGRGRNRSVRCSRYRDRKVPSGERASAAMAAAAHSNTARRVRRAKTERSDVVLRGTFVRRVATCALHRAGRDRMRALCRSRAQNRLCKRGPRVKTAPGTVMAAVTQQLLGGRNDDCIASCRVQVMTQLTRLTRGGVRSVGIRSQRSHRVRDNERDRAHQDTGEQPSPLEHRVKIALTRGRKAEAHEPLPPLEMP